MKINLIAIDPAKTKPSWGARFFDGKFQEFVRIDYKKIIDATNWHMPDMEVLSNVDATNICLLERPYVNQEHSPRSQISLAIAVGEIAFYMRLQDFKIEEADSWGSRGWIQSFFGQGTNRENTLLLAGQIAKADKIETKNNDQAVAYCLGKWWLANNY